MKIRTNSLLLLALVGVLFLLLTSSVSAQISIEGALVTQVADDQGLQPDNLSVEFIQEVYLPLTRVSFYQAKVIDPVTGNVYGAAVDANGQRVDSTAVRQVEKELYRATYGKLAPSLYNLLQSMSGSDTIQVAFWLKTPDFISPARPSLSVAEVRAGNTSVPPVMADLTAIETAREKTEQEIAAAQAQQAQAVAIQSEADQAARQMQDQAYQQAIGSLAQQMAQVNQPFVTQLQLQGFEPDYVSTYAPIVIVTLPKDAILSFNSSDEVDTIYGPGEYKDMLDSARPTQKGDLVTSMGYAGSGVKVALLEDNRINFSNPYIPLGVTRDLGGLTDDHSAATAGIVASTHPTYRGISNFSSIYSANAPGYIQANITAAMDWVVSNGVNVINNSWGGGADNTNLDINDRHLDYIVRYAWHVVTVAAGNSAGICAPGNGYVTSPARGYNVISVGNYADNNTLTWSDDVMDGCSSFVNPSTGMEKPELAAVGSDINSTTNALPWVGNVGSGTSYSSPMVAGLSALMMQKDPLLMSWPEMPKAILLATALHNIEGSARLSDKDGAGGVDMLAAFHNTDILGNSWGEFSHANFPAYRYFSAYSGELVRVAITWDSNPTGDYTSDPLQADLDLTVTSPTGDDYYQSNSYDNSYEIVEFTAPDTGTYEVKITDFRFDGSTEFIGMAWWTGNRVLSTYSPIVSGSPAISYDYYRASLSAPYWNAIGISSRSARDYDLFLSAKSAFGNPAEHIYLTWSATIAPVDFVLVDNNHAPLGNYYLEVHKWSGSGDYPIEFANRTTDIDVGIYGPYPMTGDKVLRVWDVDGMSGIRKYYAIRPAAIDLDLGMALYESSGGNYYKYRDDYIVSADSNGAGGSEYMNYLPATSDWMGLVVWNNGATTNTSFHLYADTTPPAGTISIKGGAAYTNSTAVILNLSAVDDQTGVYQMRFSNNNSDWSAWEADAPSRPWTLTSGDGIKTVYVQYKNNAEMVSSSIADTIVLDTVKPTGTLIINGNAPYTNSTNVMLTLSASDDRSGINDMLIGNLGGGLLPWEPYATSKAWTLISGDSLKVVLVQYRDNAGNISDTASDNIILDTIPPAGSISINSGTPFTTSTAVNLTLSATDATSGVYQMQFSNDGVSWSALEAYGTSKSWTLTAGDGTKTVYVRYRDNAGNTSGSFTDSIILDTAAPTGSIIINSGASFTNSTSVSLALSASDAGTGVSQMRFSNDGVSWSGWQAYGSSYAWSLTGGDGAKTVYVQYRDGAGFVSSSFTDGIILDSTPPSGTININAGAAYTNSTSVSLALSASDATSGVYQMQFSNDGSSWSLLEAYSPSKSWTLVGGDGIKTVYVRYRDNAGNTSGNFTDTIVLDTTPPSGSININAGAIYASSTSVSLTLSATDAGSGVFQMQFSNDGSSWSTLEAYGTGKSWTLTGGDGSKTVYVRYRDTVGNTSGNFTDSIVLDTTPPSGSISINTGDPFTASTSVNLDLSATDAGSGVSQMRLSNDGVSWNEWIFYSVAEIWTLTGGDGSKSVYVQYRDGIGNTSGSFTDSILLDTVAPTGAININAGAAYTNSTSVNLTLSAADAGSGVVVMQFSNDGSTWSGWEAYSSSKSWTLASGNGIKTVYVQYGDGAGNASANFADTILLDTLAPSGTIIINAGTTYATSTSVDLTLSASDAGSGVSQMQFSNDASTWSVLETYNTSKIWSLTGGDGMKIVYVRYRDNAGNTSANYTDSIILDMTPPSGSISINAGAAYTSSTSVSLTLSASDVGAGMDAMCFSNDSIVWSSWEAYAAIKPWTLTGGDGVKTVYVRYRDGAGNTSANITDTIILDTTAPSGSIAINAGASATNSTSVNLTLSATDAGTGVSQMQFSNDGSSWSGWEAYSTSKAWELTAGDGAKTVYAQFRDGAGISSGNFTDTIYLDTVPPTSSATSPSHSVNLSFTVSWTGSDPGSGVAFYDVQYRIGTGGVWTDWLAHTPTTSAVFGSFDPVTVVRGETYYFRVRAYDGAGNMEDYPAGDGDTSTYIDVSYLTYIQIIMRP